MSRNAVLLASLLLAPLALSVNASAAPYFINHGGSWAAGFAINNSGAIAGVFDQSHPYASGGFLYDNGVRDLIGADSRNATAINATNQVVGDTNDGKIYLYSNGQRQDFSSPDWRSPRAFGVNDSGQIVGTGGVDPLGYTHAFSYFGGTWTDLGHPDGYGSAGLEVVASDVNNSGAVVGTYDSFFDPETFEFHLRGFLYENGVAKDIGTLGGATTVATAINDLGQIVGWSASATGMHAFLYSEGIMHDLGAFSHESYAYGINDLGQVVGVSDGKPFLYSNGVMVDLSTQFYDPEWRLAAAYGINNFGQIVGSGFLVGGTDQTPYSIPAAFILTPVPEPSSYSLAYFAIVSLAGLCIRRRPRCLSRPRFNQG
jgi:probable HAF family extracellular repeat protein